MRQTFTEFMQEKMRFVCVPQVGQHWVRYALLPEKIKKINWINVKGGLGDRDDWVGELDGYLYATVNRKKKRIEKVVLIKPLCLDHAFPKLEKMFGRRLNRLQFEHVCDKGYSYFLTPKHWCGRRGKK